MRDGFIKAAAGTPETRVADCEFNKNSIIALIRDAAARGVKLLTLPELCVTGYTCGDLFLQDVLLFAAEGALADIMRATAGLDILTALGIPVRAHGKLFNCAAVIFRGELLALVPKTYLPNYGEYYEKRLFESAPEGDFSCIVELCGQQTCLSSRQLFCCSTMPELTVGVEICEDLWSVSPPSVFLATHGATVIMNLSASNELVGKALYRQRLVCGQSARLLCGYIYADAGSGESTTDMVFCAHNLVAENGCLLSERRFETGLCCSELDLRYLAFERRRLGTFPHYAQEGCISQYFALELAETRLSRAVDASPFVPENKADRAARCEEILLLQALGLKKRMEHSGCKSLVVGVSGGLDSTLALLVSARALELLQLPESGLLAVTMPCFGTTARTRSNAEKLSAELGAAFRVVDIGAAVRQHFSDIGHDFDNRNVVFENAQARERTQVLMDIANASGALVVGTGDMSELALGWATYNGDHMSMYGVNAGVPKTLVRHLVSYCAETAKSTALSAVLLDILATPVSPELLPAENGDISQKTEELVGPYELHDFFLYYLIRRGCEPKKVFRLAKYAFAGAYDDDVILKWLKTFIRRFFAQQYKRSCLPDGPKVGSLSLSPRGDWRMPSDAVADVWLRQLEEL